MRLSIHTIYALPNGTTRNAHFTCTSSERNIGFGYINITFVDGVHVETGRKISAAQFCNAGAVFSYEDE